MTKVMSPIALNSMKKAIIYTNGKQNKVKNKIGGGSVLIMNNETPVIFYEKDIPDEKYNGGALCGEIKAVYSALRYCIENGIDEAVIYYDNDEICDWPDGKTQTNKDHSRKYALDVNEFRKKLSITFKRNGYGNKRWSKLAAEAAEYASGMIDIPIDERSLARYDTTVDFMSPIELDASGMNKECIRGINEFKKIECPSFEDYARIKTYGKDRYSAISKRSAEIRLGLKCCEYISERLDSERDYITALRWVIRGLSKEDAVRKVLVDKDIDERHKQLKQNTDN